MASVEHVALLDALLGPINPATSDRQDLILGRLPVNSADPNNSFIVPPAASATVTGTFTDISAYGSCVAVVVSDTQLDSAQLVWSSDGVSPVTPFILDAPVTLAEAASPPFFVYFYIIEQTRPHDWVRLEVTATATPPTLLDAKLYLNRDAFNGMYNAADEPVSTSTRYLNTRGITIGQQLDDQLNLTDDYGAVQTTSRGALKVAIPWEVIKKYATPTDPTLVSGPTPTIHPTLNTETNVVDTGWVSAREFPGGNFLHLLQQTVGCSLKAVVGNASDVLGNNAFFDVVRPAAAFAPLEVSAPYFDDYFRFIFWNDSGVDCDTLTARAMGLQTAPPGIVFSLDQNLPPFIPAAIGQNIIKGFDGTEFQAVAVDSNGNLKVAPGARLSQGDGRSHVDASYEGTTSAAVHTVSASKVFQLTSLIISAQNISIVVETALRLRDGGALGTIKVPFILPEGTNQTTGLLQQTISFPEPIPFTTDVFLELAGGVPTASVTIVGYEEPV